MHAVISGQRPSKPENAEKIGVTEVVWKFLGECWRGDRAKRPVISEILRRFCEITGEGKSTDSAIEVAIPRLDIAGDRNSVVSENPPSTVTLCELYSSLSFDD